MISNFSPSPDLVSAPRPPGYFILSPEQIEAYYEHVKLPAKYRYDPKSGAARDPERALPYLSAIIRHHAAAIPFENLTLHYDRSHTVTLAHDVVFAKAVTKTTENGEACNRGGYCLENGGLLLCVLRSLGFDVYPTGGRINKQYSNPDAPLHFESWGHLVNLVRIGGTTYLADVGMSLGMPASAVALDASSAEPIHNHGTFSMRLRKGRIQELTSDNQELWIYEARFNDARPWLPIMCFSEVEFIQDDFERMNFYINGSRRYWMTVRMIVCKLILDDDEEGTIIGMATLTGNVVKRYVRGQQERVVCDTEEQRVAALEKYFNIRLTREERRGIEGLPSALKGADLYG